MRKCIVCDCEIPEGRIKAIPGTQTCTAHSNVQQKAGVMVYDHKTAPELSIISPEQASRIKELTSKSPFERSGKKNG
jgi:hypothetical protein